MVIGKTEATMLKSQDVQPILEVRVMFWDVSNATSGNKALQVSMR